MTRSNDVINIVIGTQMIVQETQANANERKHANDKRKILLALHLSDYPVDISAAVTANVPADIAANASADADAVAMRSLDARAVAPTLNFDKSFWIWTGEKPVPFGVRPFRKIVPPSSTKCPVCATIIISRSVFIFRWKRRTHTLILVTILIPSL